ncbi:MAG TPA: PHP domain-containing protein [Chitinispirillaceae bacterium]|nr:PHP domain-containing protein [Chitinispirillaceae bacterium]
MLSVNTHINSPYSFSSFDSIEQVVKSAREEMISVLGISDTGTMDGFDEFESACQGQGIFPLFNVEFETLSIDDQMKGNRWNDLYYPGKIYLCGKGLNKNPSLSTDTRNLMGSIWKGTQDRIWKVLSLLNDYLRNQGLDIDLTYNEIRRLYARNSVRGRHIARALYMTLIRKWNDPLKLHIAFRRLFNDTSFSADTSDAVAMQNEIRKRLLVNGKVAFVEKKHEGILCVQEAKRIILEAGGIPCYLMQADEQAGLTECEKSVSGLARRLSEMGIYAIEFIPHRMSIDLMKEYALYFYQKGFCVTFGTGYNTFEYGSFIPVCRGNQAFDDELKEISYQGACIVAANQEMHRRGLNGFVDEYGERVVKGRDLKRFIDTGDELIRSSIPMEHTASEI